MNNIVIPRLLKRFVRLVFGLVPLVGLPFASPALAFISGGDNAELALYIWDPVREVSYTKDLGIKVNDFFATGQQDAGYQQFWTLSGVGDTPFQQLRNLNTPSTSLRWAVLGFDTAGFNVAGDFRTFMTLEQGPAAGVLNDNYVSMTGWTNADWSTSNNQVAAALVTDLNLNTTNNPFNLQTPIGAASDVAYNGTSFTVKGQPGYFDKTDYGIPTFSQSLNASITNSVGRSSWFYYVTRSTGTLNSPVVVDEFDNLSADGYWGLVQDPTTGNFVLSYTLTAARAVNLAVTDVGRARASATELRSGDITRVIAAPTDEFVGASLLGPVGLTVSAVPEPAAWWLAAAGLLALAALRRKRRTEDDAMVG